VQKHPNVFPNGGRLINQFTVVAIRMLKFILFFEGRFLPFIEYFVTSQPSLNVDFLFVSSKCGILEG